MHRSTQQVTAATAVLAVALLAGCSARDRAGGLAAQSVTTLTFAQGTDSPPDQLVRFADQVKLASGGALKIEFRNGWRRGEPDSEVGIIDDVRSGKADLGWVGARVFDEVGVMSFQALLAPLLVDSQDLQQQVFAAGIPEEMLSGIDRLGLGGIGVLPGPMRKLMSKGAPFSTPAAIAGRRVGIQASKVAEKTFAALGATTVHLGVGADISGVDGYELQLSSIWGSHYEESGARNVVGNLNLWPRPLVIFMGKPAYERLGKAQRKTLRLAAAAALGPAGQVSRDEDRSAAANLCRVGVELPEASDAELATMRQAVTPVYDEIAKDAKSAAWLARIRELKARLGAGPDTASCMDAGRLGATTDALRSGSNTSIPEGTYEVTITDADWRKSGLTPGGSHFTLSFENGVVTARDAEGVGFRARYTIFRDKLETQGGTDPLTATFVVHGKTLIFTDVDTGTCADCEPYHVVWGSHPWTRVTQ